MEQLQPVQENRIHKVASGAIAERLLIANQLHGVAGQATLQMANVRNKQATEISIQLIHISNKKTTVMVSNRLAKQDKLIQDPTVCVLIRTAYRKIGRCGLSLQQQQAHAQMKKDTEDGLQQLIIKAHLLIALELTNSLANKIKKNNERKLSHVLSSQVLQMEL